MLTQLDKELLEKAAKTYEELQVPIDVAINVFLAKSIEQKGFPFAVSLEGEPDDIQSDITNSQITESIRSIIQSELPAKELHNLAQLEYSKHTFGISFPVIKKAKSESLEDIRIAVKDSKGRNRYSTTRVARVNGQVYVICTQWTDRHRSAFARWQKVWG
ncbi:addiction module antitoxin [Shewanella sp. 10N.286.54.B9]|uniref:addiction module antitoxin n=1 Tax=Shewanella sp. 10N.286.54.B9 TaxID=3229719 RepID=UPI00354E4F05